ncbi:hypothetical protein CBS101457_003562 [Exobasidium rhododendri]|nr:hypothetical protein CBS101457_003562 [Exobasidium rhododendri]
MGSLSSKPDAEAPQHEKAPISKEVRQKSPTAKESPAPLPSNHHAADRMMRINAEASISRQSSPGPTATHRKISNMPIHETTHAEINLSALKAWDAVALDDPTSQLAAMTIHNTVIRDSVRRRDAETADHHIFSHTIPMQGTPIVNQQSSGRCWLFATTNVIRLQVIKQLNLKEFELSQSYLAFWDKLEKSNTFLENSIELADRPLDDRVFGFLKTAPTNDGGQWDMVTNLIKKYGLVPKANYPESYNSSNSSQINWLLTLKLREYALELRALKQSTLRNLRKSLVSDEITMQSHILKIVRSRKDEQMAEVYRMMVIALGVPPKPDESFTFEYLDREDKFHAIKTTPREFLDKYTGSFDPSGACSLVNDPRRSYSKLITVDRLQNVWGGQPVLYVNTSTTQMKDCVVASIKAGLAVFFGCDVGQFSERKGIMDTKLYDYELAFGIKLGLTKAERLEMGESSMTHAMVITGVHLDDKGKPVRYRVENSWGPDAGEKGYMVMTDAWFDQFVYQVVIRKQHMPKSLWKLFEDGVNGETDVLPPYDPMGSLASSASVMQIDAAPSTSVIEEQEAEQQNLESSSDIPEDEYEIEQILDHEVAHFKKNEIAYLVSWKGYGKEHNSWVRDCDAENAPDMINSYWATASKVGVALKANGKGWTGSKSNKRVIKKESPAEAALAVPSVSKFSRGKRNTGLTAAQEDQAAKKRARVASQANYSRSGIDITEVDGNDESEMEMTSKQLKQLSGEEQARRKTLMATKKYIKMAEWESVVRHVETVERLENGKLIAFLIFDNGERYAYEASVCNHRCPQKMISFYESRLRFKVDAAQLPPLTKASAIESKPAEEGREEGDEGKEGTGVLEEAENEGEGEKAETSAASFQVGDSELSKDPIDAASTTESATLALDDETMGEEDTLTNVQRPAEIIAPPAPSASGAEGGSQLQSIVATAVAAVTGS